MTDGTIPLGCKSQGKVKSCSIAPIVFFSAHRIHVSLGRTIDNQRTGVAVMARLIRSDARVLPPVTVSHRLDCQDAASIQHQSPHSLGRHVFPVHLPNYPQRQVPPRHDARNLRVSSRLLRRLFELKRRYFGGHYIRMKKQNKWSNELTRTNFNPWLLLGLLSISE